MLMKELPFHVIQLNGKIPRSEISSHNCFLSAPDLHPPFLPVLNLNFAETHQTQMSTKQYNNLLSYPQQYQQKQCMNPNCLLDFQMDVAYPGNRSMKIVNGPGNITCIIYLFVIIMMYKYINRSTTIWSIRS